MAAAYLFHLCNNHPFVDGNKRTASFCAILFLAVNGIPDDALPEEGLLESITFSIAQGKSTKREVAEWFQSIIGSHPVSGDATEK
jgi:death-on-curing protein